uniref:Uncharacterized protein n=1 Tax=Prymnesium polylepis TaxID=72548 RepID=A0A6T7YKG0_9EUKA
MPPGIRPRRRLMRQLPQPRRAPVVACASDLLLTPADWSIDVEARRADHSVTSPTLPGSQLAQDLRHAPRSPVGRRVGASSAAFRRARRALRSFAASARSHDSH